MGSFGENQKAVIYCRVSSEKQVKEGDGLNGQEAKCKAYAHRNDLEVVETFKEAGVSGGSNDRPALYELLNYIKPIKEDVVVIIDDVSRLARNVVFYKSFKVQIKKNGGELRCVSMTLDETPEGQFVETIVAATAELEKEQNTRRVKDRQKSRLEAGYWVFMQPLGYKYTTHPIHGKLLVPHEPTASSIRKAFEKFASNELITQKMY